MLSERAAARQYGQYADYERARYCAIAREIQLGAPPVELQPAGLLKKEIQRLCIGAGRGLYYLLVCGVLYEHGVILHVLLMDAQKVQGQEQQRSRDEQCEHAL